MSCVKQLTIEAKVESEKAIKACNDAAKIAARTTTRVANEAADATKASRPVVLNNGWNGWSGGYGGGYYQQRPWW